MKVKSWRTYLLTGLIVWLPLVITFWVLGFIIGLFDNSIKLLPSAYSPDRFFGFHVPGLGLILSLSVLFLTGFLVQYYLGQKLFYLGEKLLQKIPLVRSVYNASKQIIEAIFASNSQAFRKVLLVEYPREGVWTLAFQTSSTLNEFSPSLGKDMMSLFVPTTPNPTSGFLIFLPKSKTIELSLSVDDALKYIISLGAIQFPPV